MREGVTVAEGWRSGQTYWLSLKAERFGGDGECLAALVVVDSKLWHKRLGHINSQTLLQISKMALGVNLESEGGVSSEICEVCVQGKQTKLPFKGSRAPTTRLLERIHSDLCGPITPTAFNGVKYILTLIEDFSHFTVIYGLKSNSEVFEHLKVYEARVTSKFNLKISQFRCDNGTEYVNKQVEDFFREISQFRCDNGTEYVNKQVEDFFREKGIDYELTIPGTPENNGVAERMNRTLLDKGRCLLLGTELSKSFWFEAVLTATYLTNRTPTRALGDGMVPAERWFGRPPDLSKLRVFGCIAYLHVPKNQSGGKFEARADKCVMLGYTTNGYRLWHLEKDKIIMGRSITFDETNFSIGKGCSNQNIMGRNLTYDEFDETDETNIMGRNTTYDEFNETNIMGRNTTYDVNDAAGETNSSERKRESCSEHERGVGSSPKRSRASYFNEKSRNNCSGSQTGAALSEVGEDHSGDCVVEELEEKDKEENIPLRRSCRARLLPKHFKDFSLLVQVARFASEADEPSQLNINPIKIYQKHVFQPFVDEEKIALNAIEFCDEVPSSLDDLKSRPDKEKWWEAVNEELQALKDNDTWVLVPLPNDNDLLEANGFSLKNVTVKEILTDTKQGWLSKVVLKGKA